MLPGDNSPWGEIQTVKILAPGIELVSTAGHGGMKLSFARNAMIPAVARKHDGWYEEDCEVAIPMAVFFDEIKPSVSTLQDLAVEIANYFPKAFQALTDAGVFRT